MTTADFNFTGPDRRIRNFNLSIDYGAMEEDGQIWLRLSAQAQRTESRHSWWENATLTLSRFPEQTILVAGEHPV